MLLWSHCKSIKVYSNSLLMSVFLYVLNDVLNTCVLVVIDWFSKSCRLLPLKGLPTAMETAMLMFNKIFRYYGIPEDVVSDRGPQFISKVWKVFFSLLGVTARLSSGYHPQSNGQTERKIQEAGCFLRTFCHGHQNPWIQFLAVFIFYWIQVRWLAGRQSWERLSSVWHHRQEAKNSLIWERGYYFRYTLNKH